MANKTTKSTNKTNPRAKSNRLKTLNKRNKESYRTSKSSKKQPCLTKCPTLHHFITLWFSLTRPLRVGSCTFPLFWQHQQLRKLEFSSWRLFTRLQKSRTRITCGSVGLICSCFWVIWWVQLRRLFKIVLVLMFTSGFWRFWFKRNSGKWPFSLEGKCLKSSTNKARPIFSSLRWFINMRLRIAKRYTSLSVRSRF